MDIMSIIGVIGACALVVYGIYQGGTMTDFIDPGSIAITIGGTFAALMVTFPLKSFLALPKMFAKIFIPQKFVPNSYINQIIEIAQDARKNNLLYLEDKLPEYKDDFLRKGIQLAVDGSEPEAIRDIMETELGFMMERHKAGINFFEKGAALAPGFGMIGTLIGLINMLKNMESDSASLGKNMGVALITTFYGSMLANVIFMPMGNKLKQRSDEEVLCKQIIIEGVIAIVNGENPKHIQEKLLSFIPPTMRSEKAKKGKATNDGGDE